MSNPLMQMMGGGTAPGGLGNIKALMGMMQGRDPNAVAQMLAQKNPQFAQFLRECQGKTPEQVAQQYGVDLGQLRQMLK